MLVTKEYIKFVQIAYETWEKASSYTKKQDGTIYLILVGRIA